MKKLLVVLLALSLIFAFAACGQQEAPEETPAAEGSTVIPLGGGLGDYALSGVEFGSYVQAELPAELFVEGAEHQYYVDETAQVSAIAVCRCPNAEGKTLDELCREDAAAVDALYINTTTDAVLGVEVGCYYGGFLADSELGADYYYYTNCKFIDGEDIVDMLFLYPCEELAIGESGLYAYIPGGYQVNDYSADYPYYVFGAKYESENLPDIYIASYEDTYENYAASWADCFGEDAFPISKEEYDSRKAAGWDDAANQAQCQALNAQMLRAHHFSVNDAAIDLVVSRNSWYLEEGQQQITSQFFYTDEANQTYEIWLCCGEDAPAFGQAFADSLHRK